jgi:hypothetical protein
LYCVNTNIRLIFELIQFEIGISSNQFKQNIIQNIPSAKINFANKKLKINAGSGFGFTNFELRDLTFNKDYIRNYVNFFPAANITYTYKPNHSIRFSYNGNTRQPTINQLQPLRNNNDFFNEYIGNPDLKPSFTNSFNLSHNSYNFIKDLYAYININGRLTSNSITNNRTIDINSGKIISQPVNTNGNLSLNLYSGGGFKIKKLDTRVNVGPNVSFNKYADVINSKISFSRIINTGLSVGLSKAKEKKYDISVSNNFSYTSNTTSQNDTKIHYYINTVYFNSTFYIDTVWSISTNYEFYSRQKTVQFNTVINTHLLNARLQRTFKKDEFTAYISVRDLLNQNVGIQRNFYGNTYTEVINDRLKRYFLLGFTWNFKNKTAQPK